MKDIRNIRDIVAFYKNIQDVNLFREDVFSVDEYLNIEESLSKNNQKFLELCLKNISANKVCVKALQSIVNELYDIYNFLYSEIITHQIQRVEQSPLFRYPILLDHKALSVCFSKIAVVNNLSFLINQMQRDYPYDILIENDVKSIGYAAPYSNTQGYYRYVFSKLISPDFLSKECYNKKEQQEKKINEFLELFTDDPLHIPISFYNIKDESSKAGKTDINIIQEINDSQIFINQAFELFPDEIPPSDFNNLSFDKQNEKDKTLDYFSNSKFFIKLTEKYQNNGEDYIKDLFFSVKDHHKFINNKTSLTDFRELFNTCNLSNKIILLDHLKFYALLKFLRKKQIINPSKNYLVLFSELFVLKENIKIEYKSLQGSKTKLTYKEESQIIQIFK